MRWAWAVGMVLLACVASAQRPIRGGDRLRIECEQESTLNRELTLTQQGVASFGVLGPLDVAGLVPEQLARRLESLLVERLALTRATIVVTLLARDDLPVRYAGAVARSGEIEAVEGLRLSVIVEMAQPTPAADLEAIKIVGDDGREQMVDFTRAGEDPERFDPLVRSGDRVFFPQATGSSDVFVLGGVAKPRNVPASEARTVRDALEACGGLVTHANRRDVTVLRGSLSIRLLLPRDELLRLRRGDTVRVGIVDDRSFVTVAGAVTSPGRVPYFAGMTLSDVLSGAGGPLPSADTSRIVVKAGTGMRRPDANFGAGDLIEVPVARDVNDSFLNRVWQVFRRIGG